MIRSERSSSGNADTSLRASEGDALGQMTDPTTIAAPAVGRRSPIRLFVRALPVLLLAAVLAYLYAFAPNFFRPANLLNILVQSSALGLMAIGMTLVMITGGIDLSLPANMALGAVLGGFYMQGGGGLVVGCLIMVTTGFLVGAVNGVAVAYLRMTPFVVTLATLTMLGGATVWLTNSRSVAGFPERFFDLFLARPSGVPVAVLAMLVFALAASVLASSTVYGRWLYAVGINARAARVARVPVERVVGLSYALSGVTAGVAAVLLTARLGSASANMGNEGVVLDIVSACVVGGVSVYGGAGRPLGAVLGAIFITVISNSLNQLGVSYFVNLVIKGAVIIGFISLENLVRRAP